jgi:peptide-methionine (R)-S-oxide reductase
MIINPNLSEEQKRVLFARGTEAPYSGEYLDHTEAGSYSCVNCGNVLFDSASKYKSNTPGLKGWPSFDQAIDGAIEYRHDPSYGMERTEVVCMSCKAHLGHVFDDDDAPSGTHYCISSVCLGFDPSKPKV